MNNFLQLQQQQLDQLKAENDELKGIRDRNFLHALEEQEKANKLKQTLTEIKEIVTCPKKIETKFNINHWLEIKSKILQKISEVEDE